MGTMTTPVSGSVTDDATQRQNEAAAPDASTWLSANAGSGKTRVLTDRVARLLLNGVNPQNILCLTYTKAAASEMQNRLFKRLGSWSMTPDSDLTADLEGLGVDGVRDPELLAAARRLFARAIETPGGLRIQTIHSFCASLLRRFPLEAGVTPGFREMDERSSTLLFEEVLDDLAAGSEVAAVDALAENCTESEVGGLLRAVVSLRESFSEAHSLEEILDWFGLPASYDEARALEETFCGGEKALFERVLSAMGASSGKTDRQYAERLGRIDWSAPDMEALDACIDVFISKPTTKEPFTAKIGRVPTKGCRKELGPDADSLDELMARVEAVRDRLCCLRAARKSHALHRFAAAFLPAVDRRKQQMGWLDFDDLILRTKSLLSDEAVASWVLYRLDGGLDHILVDEAQDTSPEQWTVIERLAQEFTTGLGARDGTLRTIFVVGDRKQSIYSFQGADPREFERMRRHFAERLRGVNQKLRSMELEHSFRSSDAILKLVDSAIDIGGARHKAFHERMPGRVDLWPPVEKMSRPDNTDWYNPVDLKSDDHHDNVLAREIAGEITRMIEQETLPAKGGARRRIKAGDFLILVRRRATLFNAIIRECKAHGLQIAGADRLELGAELAVKDITALMAFLDTPADDLSLAAALRSPLFGWSESELYGLAANRGSRALWEVLSSRKDEFPDTLYVLEDLRGLIDYMRPFDLIERILTRHDGRRNLLARLGPEAEDGIDALLAQSLAYEELEIPTLTGFLSWFATEDIEIKRQVDSAGDLIRVMTVHGAKGLEAPIVILPDTARRTVPLRDEIIPLRPNRMVWRLPKLNQPKLMVEALDRLREAQTEEDQRLLYVAMTRAENWLIIAASGEVGDEGESWYQVAAGAIENLGDARNLKAPTGDEGLRYSHGEWESGPICESLEADRPDIAVPAWVNRVAVAPQPTSTPLAPSDLGGAKSLQGEDALESREILLRRGSMVHRLLDALPNVSRDGWEDVSGQLLENEFFAVPDEVAEVFEEARRVLETDELAFLFEGGVLSEVDVWARGPDLPQEGISGSIDKVVVSPDRVLAVDFKTNAVVPSVAGETPDGLLRQMGAYLAALESVYPDREVDVAILWTREPMLMRFPRELVMQALESVGAS